MRILNISLRSSAGVLALWLVALSPLAGYAQSDPMIGTWKLNVTKSKFSPGPAPRSGTLTIKQAGQGLNVRSRGIDAASRPTGIQYTAQFNGKDYPVTDSEDYDMTALKRVDASTIEQTRKRAGKVVATVTYVVAKDGKVLTITTKGTNAKGQQIDDVAVLEKMPVGSVATP